MHFYMESIHNYMEQNFTNKVFNCEMLLWCGHWWVHVHVWLVLHMCVCVCRVCWSAQFRVYVHWREEEARLHPWAHSDRRVLSGGPGTGTRGEPTAASTIFIIYSLLESSAICLDSKLQKYVHLFPVLMNIQVFYKPMAESGRLTEAEMSMIFVNWRELIMCSTKLLKWVNTDC